MKNRILFALACLVLLSSCKKGVDALIEKGTESKTLTSDNAFVQYSIKKGQHYAEGNKYKAVDVSEMKFVVKFDSTAIYQSVLKENQYDINKLYGFSDNNTNHHQFSARFGWRWSDNALRLFAYSYNNGVVSYKELKAVAIGTEIDCSITVKKEAYVFTVDGHSESFPRKAATDKAQGYQLYPYFGGDEAAPHDVTIYIKAL
jgi:hypothetical protein